jgi:hypothetical protein
MRAEDDYLILLLLFLLFVPSLASLASSCTSERRECPSETLSISEVV